MPPDAPVAVRPRVALYFTDTPPSDNPVMLIMGSKSIDIAPGDSNYAVEDRYEVPVPVQVLSVYPHAHYLGTEMVVRAILPGGAVKPLLRIAQWNFQWQQDYRYRTPVPLPKGTTISLRYTYDNSASNTANPHRPVHRVTWGPRSSDEMATLGVQVLPTPRRMRRRSSPRLPGTPHRQTSPAPRRSSRPIPTMPGTRRWSDPAMFESGGLRRRSPIWSAPFASIRTRQARRTFSRALCWPSVVDGTQPPIFAGRSRWRRVTSI